ncbi:MAG: C10 family peptidase [Bacteroidaceae bacterium]|nr:C10 family peptidase [Bacteroidaceae bacterium]
MKKFFTLSLLFIVSLGVFAGKVTPQQALQKAQAFAKSVNMAAPAATAKVTHRTMSTATSSSDALFYAFNAGANKGFILVSGDDRTDEILGYSTTGTFDANNMPENMKAMVDEWQRELQWMDLNNITAEQMKAARPKLPTTVVAPLMTTQWNQSAPYNNYCPVVGGYRAPTGCVATAMAQIMNYHKHPTDYTGATDRYTTNGVVVAALPATLIDWMLMLDSYNSNSPAEPTNAVAKLMQYCGASVKMGYGPSSSGAVSRDVVTALQRTFGYSSSMRILGRGAYSIEEWDAICTHELVNRRPFYISAATTDGGGHAFVCDGRDENAMYHINWGWGGYSDGYYRMSLLDATGSGIGGSTTTSKWSFRQAAIVGISPTTVELAPQVKAVNTLAVKQQSISCENVIYRNSVSENFPSFTISLPMELEGDNRDFLYGVGLYTGDQLVSYIGTASARIYAGYTYGETRQEITANFGANLSDGTYKLVPMARALTEQTMKPMAGADRCYIEAVISGNSMTLTPMPKEDFHVTAHRISGRYLIVDFENRGQEYNGHIWLRNSKGAVIGKEYVAIPANTTDNVAIWVDEPNTLTSNDIFALSTDYYLQKNFYSNGTNVNSRLTKSIELLNANEAKTEVYGQRVLFNINLKNGGAGQYLHTLRVQLYSTTSETPIYDTQRIIDVPGNGELTQPMSFDLLADEVGGTFYINAIHTFGDMDIETTSRNFTVKNGIVCYDGNGGVTGMPNTSALTVPANACAVDLRQASVSNITPNDNPNTLYILGGSSIPSTLTGKNVVNAQLRTGTINLTDGYDYYFPIDVQARKMYYRRTVTADEVGKFSTLTLPFAPTVVKNATDGNANLKWKVTEGDPDIWVQVPEGAYKNEIYLMDINTFKAYEPYFVMFPDRFAGKQIVFQNEMAGANYLTVAATVKEKMTYKMNHINVMGTHGHQGRVDNMYTMANSLLVRAGNDVVVPPFRAYVTTNISDDQIIVMSTAKTTGINTINTNDKAKHNAWYNLQGVKVSNGAQPTQKGIYIHNGKKVVVK